MLPEEDGLSTLRKIADIPALMLAIMEEEPRLIMGLDAGAGNYVTKPFGVMV